MRRRERSNMAKEEGNLLIEIEEKIWRKFSFSIIKMPCVPQRGNLRVSSNGLEEIGFTILLIYNDFLKNLNILLEKSGKTPKTKKNRPLIHSPKRRC